VEQNPSQHLTIHILIPIHLISQWYFLAGASRIFLEWAFAGASQNQDVPANMNPNIL
jgi:hypothetical protein